MKYQLLKMSAYLFVMLFLLTSCLTNVEEQEEINEGEEPSEEVVFSFLDDVKPIIDSRCLSCHSAGGNSPELTTHAKIKANAASVKDEVDSRRMPQGSSLTTTQITAIVDWIDAGALDN